MSESSPRSLKTYSKRKRIENTRQSPIGQSLLATPKRHITDFFSRQRTSSKDDNTEALGIKEKDGDAPRAAKTIDKRAAVRQTQLDLGQKGLVGVACIECGMVYHQTVPADLVLHSRYHQNTVKSLKLMGYLDEDILGKLDHQAVELRIILSRPVAKRTTRLAAKLREIGAYVNSQLQASEQSESELDALTFYVIIDKDSKVIGVASIEQVTEGIEALINPQTYDIVLSTKRRPACIGISRIWILPAFRGRGLATQLLDMARRSFIYACIVAKERMAFSQPTTDGARLALRFYKETAFAPLVYL